MADSVRWLMLIMAVGLATSSPISRHDPDSRPLSDLGQRLVSHSSLLEPRSQDPRLPIPTPQDIEAIRKVAQILVMLGEQHSNRNQQPTETLNSIVDTLRTLSPKSARIHKCVIPSIIMGDSGTTHTSSPTVEEIPNDPVEV